MESTAFRCKGETVGKETTANGPASKGVRGCDCFLDITAERAALESACVKESGLEGNCSGRKCSATRRAAWKIRVWMI